MENVKTLRGSQLKAGMTYRRVLLGERGPWRTAKAVHQARARGYLIVILAEGGDASLCTTDTIEVK